MRRASPTQVAQAARLLTVEGADGHNADQSAAAAGRVYEKLHAQLAPLLGAAGVDALMVRSVALIREEIGLPAGVAVALSSARLRELLAGRDPAVALANAKALFGTFLTLIATFIGERLTIQVLRSAWPMLEEPAPVETKK